MATKAGMVKLSDCVNGKTFYEVFVTVDSVIGFTTTVRPVYCCSRGYQHSVKKITEKRARDSYLKNPMVYFEYDKLQKANKAFVCGGIMFSAYQHSLKTSINIRRLFTTRAFAERFVKFLELSFTPSDNQHWDAFYKEQWEKQYYKDAMDDIGKQIDILDQKQTVVEG